MGLFDDVHTLSLLTVVPRSMPDCYRADLAVIRS
jgi:hypothetical protein